MKDLYMTAHDELIAEYMDKHPDADEAKVYDAMAGAAFDRMRDRYADMFDAAQEERL